jgi:hypothetical protein
MLCLWILESSRGQGWILQRTRIEVGIWSTYIPPCSHLDSDIAGVGLGNAIAGRDWASNLYVLAEHSAGISVGAGFASGISIHDRALDLYALAESLGYPQRVQHQV